MRRGDDHPSVRFLKPIYRHCRDGFINLRFLPSGQNEFVPLSEINKIPMLIERHRNENAFFGVATRKQGDGTKKGILQIPTFWVDLDLDSEEEFNELKKVLNDFPLKPSIIVYTGGFYHFHFYWILIEPATNKDILRIEGYLKRLSAYFKGDIKATDASRILRIPGTSNYNYSPAGTVEIDEIQDFEYDLADFDFLPEIQNGSEEKDSSLSKGWEEELLDGVSEGERNVAITRLTGRYLAKGLSKREIYPILLDANSRFNPPLDEGEVLRTLDSVIKTHERNLSDDGRQEAQREKVHLKITTLNEVFDYPDPSFLIDPIVIERKIIILGGYTGTGKSLVSLSIIKSVLTGEPLWGKYKVMKTEPVLLVDEETPHDFLKERIEKMGFTTNLPFYFLHFQDVKVDQINCFEALMERIREIKPSLVVIDALIRIHHQKENDSSMSIVMEPLRKIANMGTTVLVIHHHKKGGDQLNQRLRGHSDIPGGVDIEYSLTTKNDYLIFQSVKTRTKPLNPIRLKMDISDEEILILYHGTESEEILDVVMDILSLKERLSVNDISNHLKERGYELGENRLRDILKEADGNELIATKEGQAKKWFYRLNEAHASRFSPIREKKHKA